MNYKILKKKNTSKNIHSKLSLKPCNVGNKYISGRRFVIKEKIGVKIKEKCKRTSTWYKKLGEKYLANKFSKK